MLHVALAGTLADREPDFRDTPTRTAVRYSPPGGPGVNPAAVDLVVRLRADPDDPVFAPAAAWADVPVGPAALDDALQQALLDAYGFVVGYTEAMHRVCRVLRVVTHPAGAALRLPLLVTGETGTGKDLVARAVHRLGPRRGGRFVPVNLAGLPAELMASALFGHKKGAFSGAVEDRAGAVKQAENGVLFLDEVGDAPPAVQALLLRFLDGGEYQAVGSDEVRAARTRVVAATNADLGRLVREGRFRADLLQRLAGFAVALPPLRDRPDDLPLLVRALLAARGLDVHAAEAVEILRGRAPAWPGNVRQLAMYVTQFALLRAAAGPDGVRPADLDSAGGAAPADDDTRPLDDLRRDLDRRVLARRLRRFGGDTEAAARSLGISRRSVYDLARRLGLDIHGGDTG